MVTERTSSAGVMAIWVLAEEGYDGYTIGYWQSEDSALAALKERYAPPYRVKWTNERRDEEETFFITGQFEKVLHYSTKHEATFSIRRAEVLP